MSFKSIHYNENIQSGQEHKRKPIRTELGGPLEERKFVSYIPKKIRRGLAVAGVTLAIGVSFFLPKPGYAQELDELTVDPNERLEMLLPLSEEEDSLSVIDEIDNLKMNQLKALNDKYLPRLTPAQRDSLETYQELIEISVNGRFYQIAALYCIEAAHLDLTYLVNAQHYADKLEKAGRTGISHLIYEKIIQFVIGIENEDLKKDLINLDMFDEIFQNFINKEIEFSNYTSAADYCIKVGEYNLEYINIALQCCKELEWKNELYVAETIYKKIFGLMGRMIIKHPELQNELLNSKIYRKAARDYGIFKNKLYRY